MFYMHESSLKEKLKEMVRLRDLYTTLTKSESEEPRQRKEGGVWVSRVGSKL